MSEAVFIDLLPLLLDIMLVQISLNLLNIPQDVGGTC